MLIASTFTGRSCPGGDGHHWQLAAVLHLTGEIHLEPLRDWLRQGGENDLVELAARKHAGDGLERVGLSQRSLGLGAQVLEPAQEVVQSALGLSGRFFVY